MHQHILESVRAPSLPAVVARLDGLLADPDLGTFEIGAAIAEDPAVSAMVLRVANSALYGLRRPVLDVQRAAVVLGMRELTSVVWRVAVVREFEHLSGSGGFDLADLWRHSILAGRLAAALGRKARAPLALQPAELYTCGLLHDVGKLVLLDNYGERYLACVRDARDRGRPLWQIENEAFGFGHPQVGGVVAFLWALPGALQEAIDNHHARPEQVERSATVAVTVLADQLANRVQAGERPEPGDWADHPGARLAGVSLGAVGEVIEAAVADYPAIEV